MSVSKICDAGHEVKFTKDGGQIVHMETGHVEVRRMFCLRMPVI